jgi:ABC-2 type transport system ATP-binding protein
MVFDLVMELKNAGKTVFFCSHILSDVERLCNRIGLMVQGRLARVYDRKDFANSSVPFVHLAVPPLSEEQRKKINPIVNGIHEYRHEHVLSIHPSQLSALSKSLDELAVEILATRSENFSLEDLFMDVVEEQKA